MPVTAIVTPEPARAIARICLSVTDTRDVAGPSMVNYCYPAHGMCSASEDE
ncbi:MAG: hypothetical protein KGP12_05910 [Actinomycetales bacterium]|nr:hypothetical protein [Actinomycetales bacterium]